MSSSNIQILMHEGELAEIIDIINFNPNRRNAGCLFGLWRNSLIQPVVQFVTGPGEDEEQYREHCKKIMERNHALLKLGYWYSGDPDEAVVTKWKKDEKLHLLLFINTDVDKLPGKFFYKKGNEECDGVLHQEDILKGESSFRLHTSLTNAIKQGAKNTGRQPRNNYQDQRRNLNDLSKLVNSLPSRVQISDAETRQEQWYSEDGGVALLQAMFQYLKQKGYKVEMSRDSTTHNLQFTVDDDLCIDFPVGFPNGKTRFTTSRNQKFCEFGGVNLNNEICQRLLQAIRTVFQS